MEFKNELLDISIANSIDEARSIFLENGIAVYRCSEKVSAQLFARKTAEILNTENSIPYEGDRISPRSVVDGAVYTSTDFSSIATINFHNECAGKNSWPLYISFCCSKAADVGGATTVSKSYKIIDQLSDETRRAFEDRKVLYIRNIGGATGNSLAQNFGTEDRGKIDAMCRAQEIETEWLGVSRLRLVYKREAIFCHPTWGMPLWFNNVFFWSPLALAKPLRRAIQKLPESERPFMSYYGDGGGISEETLTEIAQLYKANKVQFHWHEGDILLLDNMRFAHGRESFKGERVVWTTMHEPCSETDCKEMASA